MRITPALTRAECPNSNELPDAADAVPFCLPISIDHAHDSWEIRLMPSSLAKERVVDRRVDSLDVAGKDAQGIHAPRWRGRARGLRAGLGTPQGSGERTHAAMRNRKSARTTLYNCVLSTN